MLWPLLLTLFEIAQIRVDSLFRTLIQIFAWDWDQQAWNCKDSAFFLLRLKRQIL